MIIRSGTDGCPEWCIALHLGDDETLHYGASREVSIISRRPDAPQSATMQLVPAARTPDERRFAFAVDTLVVVQHQETHERIPWIALLLSDGPLLDLTTDSARRLGVSLLERGAPGEPSESGAPGESGFAG